MMERVLVIGAGFLGSHIIKEFNKSGISVTGTSFRNPKENSILVDVTSIDSISHCVQRIKPDLIINCAANIQLDFLENNPNLAFSINSNGAKNVALISQKNNIRLIHISTDSVFDGIKGMYSEEDIPNPINVYAKSKALAEELVKQSSDNHVIIRTNFYGHDRSCRFLYNWILDTLKNNKELIGFSDVIFTPLEVSNLSKMIFEISMTEYNGIIHLASNEVLSKYDFAQKIAEAFSLNSNLIKRGTIEDMSFIAKRPKNTSLNNKKARQLLKTPIIPLTDWLNYINHMN